MAGSGCGGSTPPRSGCAGSRPSPGCGGRPRPPAPGASRGTRSTADDPTVSQSVFTITEKIVCSTTQHSVQPQSRQVSGVTWRAGGGARLQVVLLARLLTLPSTWSWLCRRKATSARSGDTQGPGSPRIIAAAADSAGLVYLLELELKVHPKVRNHR